MAEPEQMAYRPMCTQYAGVQQRWLVIYSPQAYQRALKTFNKKALKQTEADLKAFNKLCKHAFACQADAQKALTEFENQLKMIIVADSDIEAHPYYKGKGRPAKGHEPDGYHYHISGHLASLPEQHQLKIARKSCFILATNQLDNNVLSDDAMIDTYKNQQKVERGFRFLKDPLFMASSIFLKSPKRIMALLMVMTLCLLVYAALEYRIRQALKHQQVAFVSQKGKLIDNPTARWVFLYFAGIHVLSIASTSTIVLNLDSHHLALLQALGDHFVVLYA